MAASADDPLVAIRRLEDRLAAAVEQRPRLRTTRLRTRAAFAVAEALADLLDHAGVDRATATALPGVDGDRLQALLLAAPGSDATLRDLAAVAQALHHRFALLFVPDEALAAAGARDLVHLDASVRVDVVPAPHRAFGLLVRPDRSGAAGWPAATHAWVDVARDTLARSRGDTAVWQLLAGADEAGGKLQLRFSPPLAVRTARRPSAWGAAAGLSATLLD